MIVLLMLSYSLLTLANEKGLGVSFGNPTGLNGKYWLGENTAIDGGMGLSLGQSVNFSVHSDFLYHQKVAFYFKDEHPLDLYYGVGARFEFADAIEGGIRVPVGLLYNITEQSADVFVEAAPIIDIISRKGLELHLLSGARYYF